MAFKNSSRKMHKHEEICIYKCAKCLCYCTQCTEHGATIGENAEMKYFWG